MVKELNKRSFRFIQFYNRRHQNFKDKLLIVAYLNCFGVEQFLEKSVALYLFQAPHEWVLLDKPSSDDEIHNAIRNITVSPETKIALVKQSSTNAYDVKLIYRFSLKVKWIIEPYACWDSTNGLQLSRRTQESPAVRRRNLHRYQIKTGFVVSKNDSIDVVKHEINLKDSHIDTITKVSFQTSNHVIDYLNATSKHIFTNTWGYLQKNNTWNGLSGYLFSEEIDLGGSAMFITAERLPFIQYLTCPIQTEAKFVFRQPKLSYTNNLFLLSFEASLWYGLVVLLCIIFLVLSIVTVWEWKKMPNNQKFSDSQVLRPNVFDIGMLIVGAACQQGSSVELKCSSGRVVLVILFLALTFLYTSFCANIVALLQSSSTQIRTLENLLNSNLNLSVEDNSYNRHYFSIETEPVRKAIYERRIAPPGGKPNFIDLEEGVKELRKGFFAFHMEIGVGYKFVGKYFKESEKCDLAEIIYFLMSPPWLSAPKNSPFNEMFKIGFRRIEEHGLQRRQNRILYEDRPKCSGRQGTFITVGIQDCYAAFVVLSCGILISILIAILEYMYQIIRIYTTN